MAERIIVSKISTKEEATKEEAASIQKEKLDSKASTVSPMDHSLDLSHGEKANENKETRPIAKADGKKSKSQSQRDEEKPGKDKRGTQEKNKRDRLESTRAQRGQEEETPKEALAPETECPVMDAEVKSSIKLGDDNANAIPAETKERETDESRREKEMEGDKKKNNMPISSTVLDLQLQESTQTSQAGRPLSTDIEEDDARCENDVQTVERQELSCKDGRPENASDEPRPQAETSDGGTTVTAKKLLQESSSAVHETDVRHFGPADSTTQQRQQQQRRGREALRHHDGQTVGQEPEGPPAGGEGVHEVGPTGHAADGRHAVPIGELVELPEQEGRLSNVLSHIKISYQVLYASLFLVIALTHSFLFLL